MTNIPVVNATPDGTSVVVFLDGSIAAVSKKKLQVDKNVLRNLRENKDKKLNVK